MCHRHRQIGSIQVGPNLKAVDDGVRDGDCGGVRLWSSNRSGPQLCRARLARRDGIAFARTWRRMRFSGLMFSRTPLCQTVIALIGPGIPTTAGIILML